MRLLYLANIRLPTEKAHGGQIMQMCAAFGRAGAELALWHARRVNTPTLRGRDPFTHYGVARSFALHGLPCIDLLPAAARLGNRWGTGRAAFYLQSMTYLLALRWRLWRTRYDALYTRDPITLLALHLSGLGSRTFYEAHAFPAAARSQRLQRRALAAAAGVVTVTQALGSRYRALVPDTRIHTAPDAVQIARFDTLPTRRAARRTLGLPEDAFIAGYLGRFHTMDQPKGLDTLVAAAAQTDDIHVCLVGGPAVAVDALRSLGLPEARLHYPGAVPPEDVPRALAAFDVCVLPLPWTQHFAYYASPMKLFEYMASRRPIIATDLPSTCEVLTHDDTALLVPPGDPAALAHALRRLADAPALRARLAECARALVEARYTWAVRAEGIVRFMREALCV